MDKNVNLSNNPAAIIGVILGAIVIIGIFAAINGIGSSSPSTATQPTTSHILADNNTSEQVPDETPKFEPVKLHGSGNDASNTVTLDSGVYRTKATHNGQANFIVQLKGSDPSNVVGSFNEIGNYSGVGSLSVDSPGKYIVDVMADGVWTWQIVDKL